MDLKQDLRINDEHVQVEYIIKFCRSIKMFKTNNNKYFNSWDH